MQHTWQPVGSRDTKETEVDLRCLCSRSLSLSLSLCLCSLRLGLSPAIVCWCVSKIEDKRNAIQTGFEKLRSLSSQGTRSAPIMLASRNAPPSLRLGDRTLCGKAQLPRPVLQHLAAVRRSCRCMAGPALSRGSMAGLGAASIVFATAGLSAQVSGQSYQSDSLHSHGQFCRSLSLDCRPQSLQASLYSRPMQLSGVRWLLGPFWMWPSQQHLPSLKKRRKWQMKWQMQCSPRA